APPANSYLPHPAIPELPAYIAKAFKANPRAWQHFQALARTYRRDFVVWIHTAKRPETRDKRIGESIERLAAGKKLGLKRKTLCTAAKRVEAGDARVRRRFFGGVLAWVDLSDHVHCEPLPP